MPDAIPLNRGARVEPAGWPPLDVSMARDGREPPPLPIQDVFPPPWADWIALSAEAAGAPVDYVALPLLAAAGALIGNARWANPWGTWREPPALNVACVGFPGSNKSPGLDAVAGPLADIEGALNGDIDVRRAAWDTEREAAIARRDLWKAEVKIAAKSGNPPPVRPIDAEEPAAPLRRRLTSTDPTVEKAARLSASNPRGMLMIRDELAGFIASMDRYSGGKGGSDRPFWLQAYGGRPWTPDRVKDGECEVHVPHLLWGIMGGIQPDKLGSLMLAGDDDGMAARFLYAWPELRPPVRPGQTPDLHQGQEWLRQLRNISWQAPDPILVPLSEPARVVLQRWRVQVAAMERGATGLFRSWISKLPGYAVRIALILEHLAWACAAAGVEPPVEVSEDALHRALVLLEEYSVPMTARAFGEVAVDQPDRDAQVVARWLIRQVPVPRMINARDLRRRAGGPGIVVAERMQVALTELAEAGWVQQQRRPGVLGRPSSDWMVNPAVADLVHGLA